MEDTINNMDSSYFFCETVEEVYNKVKNDPLLKHYGLRVRDISFIRRVFGDIFFVIYSLETGEV